MIEAPDNILKINTDLPVSKDMPITENDSFSYDGFQVVRGEFFAHLNEPSISFASGKVYVNSACIRKLPNAEFVQILVNAEEKRLVVRPCKEEEKDSFRWCSTRRTPRQIKCTIFFAKIMQLMEWNPDYRYKLLGKLVRSRDRLGIADERKARRVRESLGIDIKRDRCQVEPDIVRRQGIERLFERLAVT